MLLSEDILYYRLSTSAQAFSNDFSWENTLWKISIKRLIKMSSTFLLKITYNGQQTHIRFNTLYTHEHTYHVCTHTRNTYITHTQYNHVYAHEHITHIHSVHTYINVRTHDTDIPMYSHICTYRWIHVIYSDLSLEDWVVVQLSYRTDILYRALTMFRVDTLSYISGQTLQGIRKRKKK